MARQRGKMGGRENASNRYPSFLLASFISIIRNTFYIYFVFIFRYISDYSSLQAKLYFNEKFRLNYRRPGIKEGENIFEECVELSLSAIKFYFDSFFGHPPVPRCSANVRGNELVQFSLAGASTGNVYSSRG